MSIPNSKLNRLKNKAVEDFAELEAFLQANRVGTLAFVGDDGFPYQIPIAYAYAEKNIYLHGSTAAGALRQLADGRNVSFGVHRTNALVLARSAFESSMHYESAVLFGNCSVVAEAEKIEKLEFVTEFLFPERMSELRKSTPKELAATLLLQLPIANWSFKVSNGWPEDPESDLAAPVWAGVVPIESRYGTPLPAPDLLPELRTPPVYISKWQP
jgi:nitroimidazol reductase NimA-like FMN-containing flavoprotein (pyridoxamine 5'-phosphate oxidase superfamily)